MVVCYEPLDNWTNVHDLNTRIVNYSGDLKSDHLKSGHFEGQISNGRALAIAIDIVPTI